MFRVRVMVKVRVRVFPEGCCFRGVLQATMTYTSAI